MPRRSHPLAFAFEIEFKRKGPGPNLALQSNKELRYEKFKLFDFDFTNRFFDMGQPRIGFGD